MNFKDKVVIITGAGRGIGLATAKKFASLGAIIVLADIKQDELDQGVAEVKKAGAPDAWGSLCDVSVETQVVATISGAIQRFGKLDVIVNNAGLMMFKPLEEQTLEDWQKIFSVDLFGAFFFIKHGFLQMKSGAAIVNISSIHAIETEPLVAPYAAAKAAVLSLTRSASIEGKPKGIRVNAILPGAINTPMLYDNPNVKSGVEKLQKEYIGQPEDIANAIVFLCSEEAGFIEGSMLRVDGGRLNIL
jgi:NAD(P)-dependent dehydrogenase (short-subunit alcohol dehydrogenase family)